MSHHEGDRYVQNESVVCKWVSQVKYDWMSAVVGESGPLLSPTNSQGPLVINKWVEGVNLA